MLVREFNCSAKTGGWALEFGEGGPFPHPLPWLWASC